MRVVLIDPPGWQKHGYNLGLAYLSGALQEAGMEVRVVDLNHGVMSDAELERLLSDFGPHVIGVSVKTAACASAVAVARKTVKICPRAVHVAGGPHVTLAAADLLAETPEFEAAFVGEAERSLVEFCGRLDAGQPVTGIPGVGCREGGGVRSCPPRLESDLGSLPYPALDAFANVDVTRGPYHLLTSRGCPYRCVFCCVSSISGRKWRSRTPEDIIAELEHAVRRYGIAEFEVDDDNFTLDSGRAKAFCRLLAERRLGLRWFCPNGVRADTLDEEMAALMAETGCHSVALGIESGNAEVLRTVKKGQKLEDIERAVGHLKRAGIHTMGYFIIGLPGATMETELESMAYDRKIGLDDSIYNLFVPYPGTDAWEWVNTKGKFLKDYREGYHFADDNECVFETEEFPAAQRMQAYRMTRERQVTERGVELKRMQHRWLGGEPGNVLIVELASFGGILQDVRGVLDGAHVTVVQMPNRSQYVLKEGTAGDLAELGRHAVPGSPGARLLDGWRMARRLKTAGFDMVLVPRTVRHISLALFLRAPISVMYFARDPRLVHLSLAQAAALLPGTLLYRARLTARAAARCAGMVMRGVCSVDVRCLRREIAGVLQGLRIRQLSLEERRLLARAEGHSVPARERDDLRTVAHGIRLELEELAAGKAARTERVRSSRARGPGRMPALLKACSVCCGKALGGTADVLAACLVAVAFAPRTFLPGLYRSARAICRRGGRTRGGRA